LEEYFQEKVEELDEDEFVENVQKITERYINPNSTFMVSERLVDVKNVKTTNKEKLNLSNREICEDYLRSPRNFDIYIDNNLLFDSKDNDRSNVKFYDNHFTVYGKDFSYTNMKIKKK
jgi:hypothetical protein